MGRIVKESDIELHRPYLVEGFPGTGLVGKITAEYLIDRLGLEYYGYIESDDIPEATVFSADSYRVRPAIRIYANKDGSMVVLNSDVAVSGNSTEFIDTVHDWIKENKIMPIFQAGLPYEREDYAPDIFGIATTDNAEELLQKAGVVQPQTPGAISGPTGALISRARADNLDSICLVVEADPILPDPEASQVMIDQGIEKIAGFDVDTEMLIRTSDEIKRQKREFAQQISEETDHKSSRAHPKEMYG